MGSNLSMLKQNMSNYDECASITSTMIVAFIIGAIGMILLFNLPIIGTGLGIAFLIVSLCIFIFPLIMLFRALFINGWSSQNTWCKINIIATIIIIILSISLLALRFSNQPDNKSTPVPPAPTPVPLHDYPVNDASKILRAQNNSWGTLTNQLGYPRPQGNIPMNLALTPQKQNSLLNAYFNVGSKAGIDESGLQL